MFRRSLIALFALLLAAPVLTAAAPSPPSFSLPDQASEVAPGVFFLGYAVENGVNLVGYAYARYATADETGHRGNAKPDNPGGGGGNGGGKPGGGGGGGGGSQDPATCYSYIAKGARWSSTEPYLFNPNSPSGHLTGVTLSGTNDAFKAWETAAGGADIVNWADSSETTLGLVADTARPDGLNEIYFVSISDANVLGYTIVWFTRSRGRFLGQIVEADMVIDDDNWNWNTGTGVADENQIDFWSVFTHEAGHWVGMGHTDTETWCEEQTMYPSIRSGDSDKRSLGIGDTAGIFSLYQ